MAEEYYNTIAKGYDELHGREQFDKLEFIKKEMIITPETKLLDVGCGTGISTQFDCTCIGIDPSKELIAIAKQKNNNKKHTFIVKKAEEIQTLHFQDDEFDYVISLTAIHHVEDLKETLTELKRIGKKFIFTFLKQSPKKETIINVISSLFVISKELIQEKDIVLICKK